MNIFLFSLILTVQVIFNNDMTFDPLTIINKNNNDVELYQSCIRTRCQNVPKLDCILLDYLSSVINESNTTITLRMNIRSVPTKIQTCGLKLSKYLYGI